MAVGGLGVPRRDCCREEEEEKEEVKVEEVVVDGSGFLLAVQCPIRSFHLSPELIPSRAVNGVKSDILRFAGKVSYSGQMRKVTIAATSFFILGHPSNEFVMIAKLMSRGLLKVERGFCVLL